MPEQIPLDGPLADAMVRTIETAVAVRRRYQFFVWTQAHLKQLLPHSLAVCGAWHRQRRELVYEVFQSVVVAPGVVDAFGASDAALPSVLAALWLDHQCQPRRVNVAALADGALADACGHLLQAGMGELLVHGVSRPQRQGEIETFFCFSEPGQAVTERQLGLMTLVMPHLHSTYLRMRSSEQELGIGRSTAPQRAPAGKTAISARERQILGHVREGRSNLQIGEQLGISALTVKNHVQKILRKLGATNRAQAVSRAIALNLLHAQDQGGG